LNDNRRANDVATDSRSLYLKRRLSGRDLIKQVLLVGRARASHASRLCLQVLLYESRSATLATCGGWLSPSQVFAKARNIVDLIRDEAARAPSDAMSAFLKGQGETLPC
jgi:hypothetical protein